MQLEAIALIGLRSPSVLAVEALLVYVPVALGAAYLGVGAFRRLTQGQFTAMVHVLLLASGSALLIGAL